MISNKVAVTSAILLSLTTVAILSFDCFFHSPHYVLGLKIYIAIGYTHFLWLFFRVYEQCVVQPHRDNARCHVASDCENSDEAIIPADRVFGDLGDRNRNPIGSLRSVDPIKAGSGGCLDVNFNHESYPVSEQQNGTVQGAGTPDSQPISAGKSGSPATDCSSVLSNE